MKPIEKLIQKLIEAKSIAEKNIENAENIDLEDMSQILDGMIDELKNIGDFEVYDEE
jgi:hypothetical protein